MSTNAYKEKTEDFVKTCSKEGIWSSFRNVVFTSF
jgi:hypothetical protein